MGRARNPLNLTELYFLNVHFTLYVHCSTIIGARVGVQACLFYVFICIYIYAFASYMYLFLSISLFLTMSAMSFVFLCHLFVPTIIGAFYCVINLHINTFFQTIPHSAWRDPKHPQCLTPVVLPLQDDTTLFLLIEVIHFVIWSLFF